MKKYFIIILGLILVLTSLAHAQGVSKVGTTAGAFLGIDIGSVGTGMGSAYVSIVNDPTAMYWNSAGIAQLDAVQLSVCSSNWIADLAVNYAGIVIPFGNYGNLGFNATFLTMDEMERTTLTEPDGTGEMFDAGSYNFGISYARKLTDMFSIGFNGKYINETIYHTTAHGFALDVGALYRTRFGLNLGMNIANYGTKMKLDGRDLLTQKDIDETTDGNNDRINARLETDSYDLPLTFRFGLSMDLLKNVDNNRFIIAVDALHPSDDVEYINMGGEYTFITSFSEFSLRAGMKEQFAKDSDQGLTLGFGVKMNVMDSKSIHFNYSFVDFDILQPVHWSSLSLGI